VDQPPESQVADDRPAQLHDLLLRVVLEEVVEQFLVDVAVVDEEALRVAQRGLLSGRERSLVAPRPDPVDRFLFQGLSLP